MISSVVMSHVIVCFALTFVVCRAHVINAPLVYRQTIPFDAQPGQRHGRILEQGPPLVVGDSSSLAHPAVIENSIRESELPPELSKSARFYADPKTAAVLAGESWFTNKEMPVFEREADNIPRENIVKLFKNAGFIRRR